jgi:hypothetical protein
MNGVYFYSFYALLILQQIFVLSGKTEAGTAGEQPARDKLMFEVNTSK